MEQIELSYQLAQDVYNKNKTLKEAKAIGERAGISSSSTNYYCSAFRHMLNGTIHTGSIGSAIREYFLQQIFVDYGDTIKRNSLYSFEQAILYREERQSCCLPTDRKILEKYQKLLNSQ